MKNLTYIIICVFVSSFGQILLKHGMDGNNLDLSSINIITFFNLIKNLYVLGGILVYCVSFVLWLYILSKTPVSYAYPFVSLSYPLVLILSNIFLREPLSKGLLIGIFCILIGTTIIGVTYDY